METSCIIQSFSLFVYSSHCLVPQMVSWTAWSGHQPRSQEYPNDGIESSPSNENSTVAVTVATTNTSTASVAGAPVHGSRRSADSMMAPGEEPKRRPVSRLWPSFSSIGRDRSASRAPAPDQPLTPSPEEEHIYEEIDESQAAQHRNTINNNRGICRAGRGGSFAGASRQDILRYLEELRKKHPTGIISVEAEQLRERKRTSSPAPHSPMTPSLPQLIPTEEEEDDEMGALLLAMRHNGPNRNSNRSTQSSTSTQSSSQESALSAPEITATSSTTPSITDYQVPRDFFCFHSSRSVTIIARFPKTFSAM